MGVPQRPKSGDFRTTTLLNSIRQLARSNSSLRTLNNPSAFQEVLEQPQPKPLSQCLGFTVGGDPQAPSEFHTDGPIAALQSVPCRQQEAEIWDRLQQ